MRHVQVTGLDADELRDAALVSYTLAEPTLLNV